MRKTQMLQILNSRKNLVGFLHLSDIFKINDLTNNQLNADRSSFYKLASTVLRFYDNKRITNKQASEIFEMLSIANQQFI